ncbi:MAG: hypothetical protein HQ510_10165 [Candidatus Marinimicrobia bacterium]|nr:hypothetical protein [Candidatus Neomarinimicrobiota bacterium]
MKKILVLKIITFSLLLLWSNACRTPSDPVGVKTKSQITIDTAGYCRDISINDSLIVVAADENGYQTYRYQLTGNSITYELINEVNDIDNDGIIDRLWSVELTDKINGHDYPLFFGMDYGDAVIYQNVNSPSSYNWEVAPDGSPNRDWVRSMAIDYSHPDRILVYVLKEDESTPTNYISVRFLDIINDFDSTIVFWGGLTNRLDSLSIESQDIYYSDSTLYIANSQLGIQIFKQTSSGGLEFKSEFDNIPGEVSDIYANNGLVIAGLTDDKGCYLALLDSNGQPTVNLRIADGYTVQGIDMYNNVLALAAGNDGVLLYDVRLTENQIVASEIGFVDTEYTYKVELVNEYCVFAATRNGIQVSFIEY